MKVKFLFYSLVLSALFISSCNKDDDPEKLDPQGDCFTAKIDGAFFNSDNVTGTRAFNIIINASFGTTTVQTFAINIFDPNITAGTYPIAAQTGTIITIQYMPSSLTSSTEFSSTSGTLIVEEHNVSEKKIRGTFNFEGEDTQGNPVSVTEGVFDVKYD